MLRIQMNQIHEHVNVTGSIIRKKNVGDEVREVERNKRGERRMIKGTESSQME